MLALESLLFAGIARGKCALARKLPPVQIFKKSPLCTCQSGFNQRSRSTTVGVVGEEISQRNGFLQDMRGIRKSWKCGQLEKPSC